MRRCKRRRYETDHINLSAFGPYAGETTLDFSELGAERLFVITGPTGSGKTTVFEATLYALYGKLSKKAWIQPACAAIF